MSQVETTTLIISRPGSYSKPPLIYCNSHIRLFSAFCSKDKNCILIAYVIIHAFAFVFSFVHSKNIRIRSFLILFILIAQFDCPKWQRSNVNWMNSNCIRWMGNYVSPHLLRLCLVHTRTNTRRSANGGGAVVPALNQQYAIRHRRTLQNHRWHEPVCSDTQTAERKKTPEMMGDTRMRCCCCCSHTKLVSIKMSHWCWLPNYV